MSKIPRDSELQLEMEEMEELIENGGGGTEMPGYSNGRIGSSRGANGSARHSRHSRGSAGLTVMTKLVENTRTHRSKWLIFVIALVIIVFCIYQNEAENVEILEENTGEHLGHLEHKKPSANHDTPSQGEVVTVDPDVNENEKVTSEPVHEEGDRAKTDPVNNGKEKEKNTSKNGGDSIETDPADKEKEKSTAETKDSEEKLHNKKNEKGKEEVPTGSTGNGGENETTEPVKEGSTEPNSKDENKDEGKEKNNDVAKESELSTAPKIDFDSTTAKTDLALMPTWNDELRNELTEKWGHWHFWDGFEDGRPKEDYCGKFPNRDIPETEFPETAWQTDAVYVNHWLDDAGDLISRAQEAIYTEYGQGKPLPVEQLIARSKMFHLEMNDLSDSSKPIVTGGGGWTTERSFQGLVRRLTHAMMTNDSFTVVLGGHSAAAGHGNHFKQSYMMQFHRIMEPIFARLGVKLITRNMAQGGMGTVHSSLGSGSIFGDEVDMLFWDSAMTEKSQGAVELFARQAVLGGKRAPMVWAGLHNSLRFLHEKADVDIGVLGTGGLENFPETTDDEQAKTLPWAVRYLNCGKENADLCKANKYRTKCWIERPDVTPSIPQAAHADSQVGWHPGFRSHQLTGRVIAMVVLEALQEAISTWSEITISAGHPLPDQHWHVTSYYENIRSKVMALGTEEGYFKEYMGRLSPRVFTTPLQARTEFLPRPDRETTSLLTIIRPTKDGYVPHMNEDVKMEYEGPDVYNPYLYPPDGEVDVLAIVSNRRKLNEENTYERYNHGRKVQQVGMEKQREDSRSHPPRSQLRSLTEEIVPGHGWELDHMFINPGECDGSYHSTCGRYHSNCMLYGHSDTRGGVIGNGLSGWLVLDLKQVIHGLIILKIETWHQPEDSTRTKDWTEINNGQQRHLNASDGERELKKPKPVFPETFFFDYAINGKIKSLNKEQFTDEVIKKRVGQNVDILHVLDDPDFVKDGPQDVEVAFRLRGCEKERVPVFKLTHVYWA